MAARSSLAMQAFHSHPKTLLRYPGQAHIKAPRQDVPLGRFTQHNFGRQPLQPVRQIELCQPTVSGVERNPVVRAASAAGQEAVWKFVRPHTIRGTILGTTAVTARALIENSHAIDWALLPRALLGLLALLCGNGYIVGINQIYDIDIDVVNKPFLPIAAGEMSTPVAWAVCATFAAAGIAITARNFGQLITGLYSFGLFLGTVYSVPPLRLKRFAVAAFAIIATVRGFLLNFGVYYATRAALQLQFQWSPAILFITCFVTVFATAIAITKDLADVEGDAKFGIDTLATRMGVRNIAFLGSGLLLFAYAGAAVAAFALPGAFRVPLMAGAHIALAALLIWQTRVLDAGGYTRAAVQEYYRWIWNLFYMEYLLLPFL